MYAGHAAAAEERSLGWLMEKLLTAPCSIWASLIKAGRCLSVAVHLH